MFACEVSVEVLGENFAAAYTEGDNSAVVATDTMKNFILRESLHHDGARWRACSPFLGAALLATYPVMEAVRVSATRAAVRPRRRQGLLALGRRPRRRRGGGRAGRPARGHGGRHGLLLLKTSGSAFTRFARDEYTTLPERGDRPLFIRLDVDWRYASPGDAVDSLAVRDHLARTFDDFVSESIQHLVHEMGTRLLADHPEIAELSFTAENHTRDPVGEEDGRRMYTDPFPAQGLITLTLAR